MIFSFWAFATALDGGPLYQTNQGTTEIRGRSNPDFGRSTDKQAKNDYGGPWSSRDW